MLKFKTFVLLSCFVFSVYAKEGCLIIDKEESSTSVTLVKHGDLTHAVEMSLVNNHNSVLNIPANKYCSTSYNEYKSAFILDLNNIAFNKNNAIYYKGDLPIWVDLHILYISYKVPIGKYTYNTKSTYFGIINIIKRELSSSLFDSIFFVINVSRN